MTDLPTASREGFRQALEGRLAELSAEEGAALVAATIDYITSYARGMPLAG